MPRDNMGKQKCTGEVTTAKRFRHGDQRWCPLCKHPDARHLQKFVRGHGWTHIDNFDWTTGQIQLEAGTLPLIPTPSEQLESFEAFLTRIIAIGGFTRDGEKVVHNKPKDWAWYNGYASAMEEVFDLLQTDDVQLPADRVVRSPLPRAEKE
jgi:hypothetical protein